MIEDLQNKKAALELLQSETNEKLNDYRQQVSIIQKQIDDYNKPELTPAQLDDIQEAIEKAVDSYNFDEVDMYDVEFGMEYDGRVHLETINLNETYNLVERIVTSVHGLFKEADAPEETEDAQLALFSKRRGWQRVRRVQRINNMCFNTNQMTVLTHLAKRQDKAEVYSLRNSHR